MPDLFTRAHQTAVPGDLGQALKPGKDWSRWPMALIAVLLFAATTAAGVMATSGSHAPIPALWKQTTPSTFTKAPEGSEYRELLF